MTNLIEPKATIYVAQAVGKYTNAVVRVVDFSSPWRPPARQLIDHAQIRCSIHFHVVTIGCLPAGGQAINAAGGATVDHVFFSTGAIGAIAKRSAKFIGGGSGRAVACLIFAGRRVSGRALARVYDDIRWHDGEHPGVYIRYPAINPPSGWFFDGGRRALEDGRLAKIIRSE